MNLDFGFNMDFNYYVFHMYKPLKQFVLILQEQIQSIPPHFIIKPSLRHSLHCFQLLTGQLFSLTVQNCCEVALHFQGSEMCFPESRWLKGFNSSLFDGRQTSITNNMSYKIYAMGKYGNWGAVHEILTAWLLKSTVKTASFRVIEPRIGRIAIHICTSTVDCLPTSETIFLAVHCR